MQILIVHPHMSVYGGAETVVKELSINLNKLGIQNKVLTLSLAPDVEKSCENVNFITSSKKIPYKLRSTSFFNALGVINEIKALLILLKKYADDFDVINVHNFPATWCLRGVDKPTVWMCNEPPDLWNNPNSSLSLRVLRNIGVVFDKFIVNRYIDAICVADEFNACRIVRRYNREPEIIPYGISYDFFASPDEEKVKFLVEKYDLKNKFILIQVGMLTPQKNQMESLKTIVQLREAIPNIKIIFAGLGNNDYEKELLEFIKKNNLEEKAIFTGHVNKEAVRDLYAVSNVALFPVKTQGGWLSPFEAMCAGKPIIVSPNMGAATLIKEKNLGIVTENFKDAVLSIYENSSRYYQMSDIAKNWARKNLSWEIFTKKMLEVFKKA